MFILNRNEYDEIVGVISKYCCDCSGAYCSEADCDIHTVYELLNKHVLKGQTKGEEEKLPFDV